MYDYLLSCVDITIKSAIGGFIIIFIVVAICVVFTTLAVMFTKIFEYITNMIN